MRRNEVDGRASDPWHNKKSLLADVATEHEGKVICSLDLEVNRVDFANVHS